MAATSIYRALMVAVEARRLELGLSMDRVNDLAGLQDGYFAKMIYPDTPSGRQAQWATVDLAMEALFGKGYDVFVVSNSESKRSAVSLDKGASTNALKNRHWRHSRHFSDLGARGGAATAKASSSKKRSMRARKASKAFWSTQTPAQRAEKASHASKIRWKRAREARRQGDARLAIRTNQREHFGRFAIDFQATGGGG